MKVKGIAAIVAICIAVLTGSVVFSHEIADGNARVELIQEVAQKPTKLKAVIWPAGTVFTLPGPDWSWMMISISDPLLGDCHNGETSADKLNVARLGWMTHSDYGPVNAVTLAYYTDTKQLVIVQGPQVNFGYRFRLTNDFWNKKRWKFEYRHIFTMSYSVLGNVTNGPLGPLKCSTAGRWTNAFNNWTGQSSIEELEVAYDYSNTYTPYAPNHYVRNNPFQYSVYTCGGYNCASFWQ
jgi:hypothetical protein